MPTLIPRDSESAAYLAAKLLRVAKAWGRKREVKTVTHGAALAFVVPDDIYQEALANEQRSVENVDDDAKPPADVPPADGDGDVEDQSEEPASETPEAPLVGGEPVIDTGADDQNAGDSEQVAETPIPEPPDRNDKTEDWAAYMAEYFGVKDAGKMTRTKLIAEYDSRTGTE
ncbi:hypothetical protein SEA_LILBEANIE_20 [Gordonia phage Lilbeanie]|uniref:Uncharacterized protein n=1 Tax=Gordonia phage Lilbeanie TaxID=2794947 RepID=A0A7T1KS84_9CAUD|nr:hypothetical protein J1773_gp20 [Gordonia phage Lilbeanie]QPO17098.1 hypothetical protein SEA_LILBEANIE_20 [Gordonia phage Lilbeanie]